ncbi:hypothetical protein GMLC_44210 [Geomonas limicola]|uniref:Putative regulatory protein FmdB zinc ribbon domain-containing protein n=1 Tax=Geomonas limicola TaxID=2740186 RepID=A0A6V8NDY4_9BACT|nr:hypothetical protein GMLC_44210 [Geomonas limicola]
MPIFEFRCLPCGTRFEKLQKGDTTELPNCPICGASEVEKVLSPFAATGNSKCTPIG